MSKTFGPTQVLFDAHLTVQPGEVHGLVGQNGSGKSTLIKLLTGYHKPDPGARISVDGRSLRTPVRWPEAHAAGVAVVHQELGLLDHLTVAENICVGNFPIRRYTHRIDVRSRDRIVRDVLERLEVAIDPRTECRMLNAAQRAEVAIARALRDQAPGQGLIILDESTRALSGRALEGFHELLRRVASVGGAILMISHNLAEVLAIANRVTVLRDGRVAGSALPTRDLSEADIATRMLGRTAADASIHRRRPDAGAQRSRVAIKAVSGAELRELSFDVDHGEVLGITGLPGSGFESLPYLLAGGVPAYAGRLRVGGRDLDLRKGDVRASLRAGVVLVPERRDRDGLAFELSTGENVALPSLRRRSRAWLAKRGWQKDLYQQAVAELAIRPPGPARLVRELSGGNQQKVLLAKWLATSPSLLILHEPTQGVDVAARQDLLRAIRRIADRGVPVILVTAEVADLAEVCDRVLVHTPESPTRELTDFDADAIILAVYGEPGVPLQEGAQR
jgi:ribose transport system ATP-binding protein